MEELSEQLQAARIAEPTSVPFTPKARVHWKYLKLSPIPRYLFRVYEPSSDGFTSDEWVKSRDAVNAEGTALEDVFQTNDPPAAATMIYRHLDWAGDANSGDNLMSGTSSLLYALQYIFYRHARQRGTSCLEDIRLCIADTTYFSERVFIRDMDLIDAVDRFSPKLMHFKTLRQSGVYYFGEYLSQGALRITGACTNVSAQDLIGWVLLRLRREFGEAYGNARYGWAKAVVNARVAIRGSSSQVMPRELISAAIRISHLFDEGWSLHIAINLVALVTGQLDLGAIMKYFRGNFTSRRCSCYTLCFGMLTVVYRHPIRILRTSLHQHRALRSDDRG